MLLLTNPRSHTAAKRGSVLARVATPGARREEIDFGHVAQQTEGAELIVVEGGDGTVQAVADALLRKPAPPPPLMLVPGGMTDLIARITGVPRDPDAVARLIERGGGAMRMPALKLSGGADAYGFFLSTGGIVRGTHFAREEVQAKGAEGGVAVAGALAGALLDAKRRKAITAPSPLTARLGEEPFGPNHRFGLVTTLPRLMLGLDPFWGEGGAPIRATFARGDAVKLRRTLTSLWWGRVPKDIEAQGYVSRRVASVALEGLTEAILDGESVAPAGPLTVTATPPLTFVTP